MARSLPQFLEVTGCSIQKLHVTTKQQTEKCHQVEPRTSLRLANKNRGSNQKEVRLLLGTGRRNKISVHNKERNSGLVYSRKLGQLNYIGQGAKTPG